MRLGRSLALALIAGASVAGAEHAPVAGQTGTAEHPLAPGRVGRDYFVDTVYTPNMRRGMFNYPRG